jgi:phage-related baseplate assembly protein
MSTQLTLDIPENLVSRAQAIALRAGQSVNDLLAESIELSLKPWGTVPEGDIHQCGNEDVLKACDLELSTEDDRRLTDLLQRQQAQTLAVSEQAELASLMQVYQEGLIRKAEALREAVRRGLRGPVRP